MKNRKLFIVSFLVVATLVVGVGFAAINGSLKIVGDAAYYGHELLQGNVAQSLSFISAEAVENEQTESGEAVCLPGLGEKTTINGVDVYQTATLDISFFDKDGEFSESDANRKTFTATARYTVKYGTEAEELPTIYLQLPHVHCSTIEGANGNDRGIIDAEAAWVTPGQDGPAINDGIATMKAGDSISFTVTVTYELPTEAEAADGFMESNIRSTITVGLPYADTENGFVVDQEEPGQQS